MRNKRPHGNDGADATRRLGHSVLEVLVAIGILGLLAALLLPAVQHSRESSRNVLCKSNLKQMGLAAQAFHETHKSLPDSDEYNIALLPFLDQAALADLIRESSGPGGDRQRLDQLAPRHLPVYVCPSDNWRVYSNSGIGPCQYLINAGSAFPRYYGNGIRKGGRNLKFSEITDGLSQTALFAERLAVYSRLLSAERIPVSQREPIRFQFYIDRDFFERGREEEFAEHCLNPDHHLTHLGGANHADSGMWCYYCVTGPSNGYDHMLPPNRIGCFRGGPFPNDTGGSASAPATSLHPGGVNVVFCDGSVRFIADGVDRRIWRALGSRAGNEAVSSL
ncbi:MAG: DUF1559 domain-containing protein [Planctomyces sp.]|nr:DUF1559 domain-containing protein [Planctomyces sp.]